MTTQSETPAVGSETPAPDADPFEAIAEDTFGADEEEEPAEAPEAEAEDDIEDEEEADDLPPIDPPVSWDADAKEKFAQLPRDVQEYVQKRESDRERFVQTKSQEAARARQEAEQAAYQQLAAYEREVSQHLQQYAQQFDVPQPDMALLATDPATYAYQAKQYQDAQAQRSQAQQQAQYYAQQAQQRDAYAEQANMAQQHQTIVEHFPEYADPTTGPKLQQELSAVARELGYPPELISQARATDILAMRKVAELKSKADKYDALNAKKTEKVRSAKGLPPVAKPGVSQGSEQLRANRATAAWDVVKSAKSRPAKDEAMAAWMKNTGWLD